MAIYTGKFKGKDCRRVHALNAQKAARCAKNRARWPVIEVSQGSERDVTCVRCRQILGRAD